MADKKKNDTQEKPIHHELHQLVSELLRSANVFEKSDDVALDEYKKLLRIFIPKLRHALVLIEKLPESVRADPSTG